MERPEPSELIKRDAFVGPIGLNLVGWTMLILGAFVSLIISAAKAGPERDRTVGYFPTVFGVLLIIVDILIRSLFLPRLKREADHESARPGKWKIVFAHAAFNPRCGGLFMFVVPVWILGAAIILAGYVWSDEIARFAAPKS